MQYFRAELRFSYFLFLYVCVLDINVVFIGSFFYLFFIFTCMDNRFWLLKSEHT